MATRAEQFTEAAFFINVRVPDDSPRSGPSPTVLRLTYPEFALNGFGPDAAAEIADSLCDRDLRFWVRPPFALLSPTEETSAGSVPQGASSFETEL
jgi:hypothetical protein